MSAKFFDGVNIDEEIQKYERLIENTLKKYGISQYDMNYDDYCQELRITVKKKLGAYKKKAKESTFLQKVVKNKLLNLLRKDTFVKKKPCNDCYKPCPGPDKCKDLEKWEAEKEKFNRTHHSIPIELVEDYINVSTETISSNETINEIFEIAAPILTAREYNVLELLPYYSQKEIAEELNISCPRVSNLRKRIGRKIKEKIFI